MGLAHQKPPLLIFKGVNPDIPVSLDICSEQDVLAVRRPAWTIDGTAQTRLYQTFRRLIVCHQSERVLGNIEQGPAVR